MPELILVRHAGVSDKYSGYCYGRSDVELSAGGEHCSRKLSEYLASRPVRRVVHSGLRRTQFLAEHLARLVGCDAECDSAIQERDYGDWELKSWDSLYQQFGEDLIRVINEPATYRPGRGETTFEMRDRVVDWYQSLPESGLTVAISHGGPIAALRGTHAGAAVREWLKLIPAYGEYCTLSPSVPKEN